MTPVPDAQVAVFKLAMSMTKRYFRLLLSMRSRAAPMNRYSGRGCASRYIEPMNSRNHHNRSDLVRIATHVMAERGLQPEFPAATLRQLATIRGPATGAQEEGDVAGSAHTADAIADLTGLLWCSIDNDDSLDLDQLTVCEVLHKARDKGAIRMLVAIADVDAIVKKGSAIDAHASTNTTSVYTSARIFPMLPERLSCDLTSLNEGEDRLALVTEMVFAADTTLTSATLYRAKVRNKAKLAYDAVSAWIEGEGPLPEAAAAVAGLDVQLREQDALAQRLRALRHAQGSLELQSFQPRAVFEGERVVAITEQVQNRARQLIEEVMIAANGCAARFLAASGGASLRRVVRSPERWLRIVSLAAEYGVTLPPGPDARALEAFLIQRRKADPLRFPDLSLIIVKLMGRGEYVVEAHGGLPIGHFGLAVRDYTHATAPNRRFPDLITQRMVKAILAGKPRPYSSAELASLALHCTQQEDAAQKVERHMRKSEAALLLESHVGQRYDAIVTGSNPDGVWVRVFAPPAEGKVVSGPDGLRVGDKVHVQLVGTNVERGFIDFAVLG
ncbi:RNB domain-containing ribonuclease [Polaromonas sp.]|uniref:RNB domain-containing ribonuclease n=1 Tax=Polaromonas sp. TaxID=1869339 RepID=UPI0025E95ECB|nr:RNB domain-containing ribonuclease [Polaromonas sp.]